MIDGPRELVGGAGIGPLEGAPKTICELKKMYLLNEARGKGLGQRLLDNCLEAARKAHYKSCYLETLTHMTHARQLYERNGFRPLNGPIGNTGHFGCDNWYEKSLRE